MHTFVDTPNATTLTLVKYLKAHSIDVVEFNAHTIICNTLYSADGASMHVLEHVPATVHDVRSYLGY